jgi:hypothetical protein
VLGFSPHPHQLLREAERALRPEGQLVISSFHTLSLWGLRLADESCGAAGLPLGCASSACCVSGFGCSCSASGERRQVRLLRAAGRQPEVTTRFAFMEKAGALVPIAGSMPWCAVKRSVGCSCHARVTKERRQRRALSPVAQSNGHASRGHANASHQRSAENV